MSSKGGQRAQKKKKKDQPKSLEQRKEMQAKEKMIDPY